MSAAVQPASAPVVGNVPQPVAPLFTAITAVGRSEYDLLALAAQSLRPLSELSREGRSGLQWLVSLDHLDAAVHTTQVLAVADAARVAVQVLTHTGTRGPGPARNTALRVAAAPWLLTLDGDDELVAPGVQRMLDDVLTARAQQRSAGAPDVAWAAGRCPHVTRDGQLLWAGPEDYYEHGLIETNRSLWHAKQELGGLPFLCTATVASTDAVRACGGWPSDERARAEDTALWAVLTSRYRGWWTPEVVYRYRRHGASLTHRPGFRQIDERLEEISAMVADGTTRLPSAPGQTLDQVSVRRPEPATQQGG